MQRLALRQLPCHVSLLARNRERFGDFGKPGGSPTRFKARFKSIIGIFAFLLPLGWAPIAARLYNKSRAFPRTLFDE
jgi:hypothetical protein